MKKSKSKELVFTDRCGTPLQAGDFIVYGYMYATSPSLKFGKVLAVREGNSLTIESNSSLSIQGVEDRYWIQDQEISLCKKSTLQYSERILKIERNQLPKKHLELLDTVKVEIINVKEKEVTGKKNRLEDVE